jgi:hypothetical protein
MDRIFFVDFSIYQTMRMRESQGNHLGTKDGDISAAETTIEN